MQRRSRAESMREARREREVEKKAAVIFAIRRRMLAMTLIWMEKIYQSLELAAAIDRKSESWVWEVH